ncbi:MAG: hypothetical protein HY394_02895 [Candidatus Diapherotrites archaeon]|nr:hypothetical protein [Candidatus Diapherotrites archaeon]
MSGLIQKYHNKLIADDVLSDSDVLLLIIYLIENQNKTAGVQYTDCKNLFMDLGRREDNFRKILHKAKKDSFVKEENRSLYFLSKGLKKIRTILGQIGKSAVYIIKSGQNFSAIKLFEEFLYSITNSKDPEILVCDSYVSPETLFPFATIKGRIKILKILTSNIYDLSKFESYKGKLGKELGIKIEVKINQKIHDRFIICDGKCWTIGSSIKDLGNKDTTIKEISEIATSMTNLFTERWNEPTR